MLGKDPKVSPTWANWEGGTKSTFTVSGFFSREGSIKWCLWPDFPRLKYGVRRAPLGKSLVTLPFLIARDKVRV